MENTVVIFPLLHLPFTEQQRVLWLWDHIDLLAFSFHSKRISFIVKSFTFKIEFIDLRLNEPVELVLRFPDITRSSLFLGYGEGSVEKAPERVTLTRVQQQRSIRSHRTLRDWILFIFDVYHGSCIRILEFTNRSLIYDLSFIKTALRGIDTRKITFYKMTNEELFKKVRKLFHPAKRIAVIKDNHPEDPEYLQRILLQNFDGVCITAPRIPYFGKLDRFLSINVSFISTSSSTMTDTTINRLLKLWIKGAMPRLNRLTMFNKRENLLLKKNAILNGINYIQRDPDQVQNGIGEWYFGPEPVEVIGGMSLLRCDGTKASIQFWEREGNVRCMDLIVWDE